MERGAVKELRKNIRFYILLGAGILALLWELLLPAGSVRTDALALSAASFLYITLLISPLTEFFPQWRWRGQAVKARRATGVSAAGFAVLHGYEAFTQQLGGLAGLSYLTPRYIGALSIALVALLILLALAATSFNGAIRRLKHPRWKMLHRLVYLAAFLVVIHALLLGSHFGDLNNSVARLAYVLVTILGLMEAYRLDTALLKRLKARPSFGIFFVVGVSFFTLALAYFAPPGGGHNLHADHAAQLANPSASTVAALLTFPNGCQIGREVLFDLSVSDANHSPDVIFLKSDKIITPSALQKKNLTFFATVIFPESGDYTALVSFSPQQQISSLVSCK